jgi:hypothetical protein
MLVIKIGGNNMAAPKEGKEGPPLMVTDTAVHEAAHAVVAAHLKVAFRYVSAVACRKYGGKVQGGSSRVARLYVSDRRGGFRQRSDEELRNIYCRRLADKAVVALAARAEMETMEFKTAGGRRLSASELGYKSDEKLLKDFARELGIRDFGAWREQQLKRARDIVAIPHVARAIRWVARRLEAERQIHAMKRGNGRLSSKDVRWILRAASGFTDRAWCSGGLPCIFG